MSTYVGDMESLLSGLTPSVAQCYGLAMIADAIRNSDRDCSGQQTDSKDCKESFRSFPVHLWGNRPFYDFLISGGLQEQDAAELCERLTEIRKDAIAEATGSGDDGE